MRQPRPTAQTLHRRRGRQAANCSLYNKSDRSDSSSDAADAPTVPPQLPPPLPPPRPSPAAQVQGFAYLLAVALLWGSYTPALR